MASAREQLHDLVERLPDEQVAVAQRLLLSLSEERIGPVFADSIRRGLAQADADETITCHDFDEMVDALLSE